MQETLLLFALASLQQVQTSNVSGCTPCCPMLHVLFPKWRHMSCMGFISHHFDSTASKFELPRVSMCFLLAMHHDKHCCRPPSCLSSEAFQVTSNQIISNVIKLKSNYRQRDRSVQVITASWWQGQATRCDELSIKGCWECAC